MKLSEDDIELIIKALKSFQKDSIKDRYNHLEELIIKYSNYDRIRKNRENS